MKTDWHQKKKIKTDNGGGLKPFIFRVDRTADLPITELLYPDDDGKPVHSTSICFIAGLRIYPRGSAYWTDEVTKYKLGVDGIYACSTGYVEAIGKEKGGFYLALVNRISQEDFKKKFDLSLRGWYLSGVDISQELISLRSWGWRKRVPILRHPFLIVTHPPFDTQTPLFEDQAPLNTLISSTFSTIIYRSKKFQNFTVCETAYALHITSRIL